MFNFFTKNEYSGSNVDTLMEAGFESEFWMTFNQARMLGRKVLKGSTGTQIIKIVVKEIKDKETGEIKKKKVPKYYTVFNLEQTAEV